MKLLGLGGIATKLVPSHEDTSRHARVLYPAQAQRAFPSTGIALGRDAISGEVACFCPWQWYADGLLTSPALFVMGEVGMGKSAFVKALILRSCGMFGRECYILDPKGEYGPMASALGIPSLRLEPGGPVRLNPLEPGPSDGTPEALARRRASVCGALATVGLERSLRPGEEAALFEAAFRLTPQAILPDLVELLLSPSDDLSAALVTTKDRLATAIRDLAMALRNLVSGRLAGMLDAPSTVTLDEHSAGLHLDLSPVYSDRAVLAPVMAAATSWMTARLRTDGPQKHLIVDEAWQVVQDSPTLTTWLASTVKLARSLGVSATFVVHRISDLRSAGEDASVAAKRAQGLLEDTQMRVLFAQPHGELASLASATGLSPEELELLPTLPRGRCLVVLGDRRALWDVVLTDRESQITDTDAAMR